MGLVKDPSLDADNRDAQRWKRCPLHGALGQ